MMSNFVSRLQRVEKSLAPDPQRSATLQEQNRLVAGFLSRFGYLDGGISNRAAIARAGGVNGDSSGREFAPALKAFQRFYGLDQTGVLDEFTRAAIQMPRCGWSDLARPRSQVLRAAAGQRTFTYRFTAFSSDLAAADAQSAVERAFATWESLGKCSFQSQGVGDVDIEISWSSDLEDDLIINGDIVAVVVPPSAPGSSQSIFFDDDHRWNVGGGVPGKFDIESVAVHEIGHILGLGHSSRKASIMYPAFVQGQQTKRNLTLNDIAEHHRLLS